MTSSRAAAVLVAAIAGLATGCRRSAEAERIVLTGSSTVAPLALELGRRFEARTPGVRVEVQTGGSSRGVSDIRAGLADIGMVSRALGPAERDLVASTIALDGIGIVVHADNPVTALSRAQVVAIFTGQTLNWKDVGGRDAPVTVVNKAEGRSTLELFLQHFGIRGAAIRAHVVIGDNAQGLKTIATNPDAIGYVSIGSAEHDAASGVPVKLLALDGVNASTETVRAGQFPLSRPLNLVTRGPAGGLVEKFLAFARSEDVHDLVQAQSFVPPR